MDDTNKQLTADNSQPTDQKATKEPNDGKEGYEDKKDLEGKKAAEKPASAQSAAADSNNSTDQAEKVDSAEPSKPSESSDLSSELPATDSAAAGASVKEESSQPPSPSKPPRDVKGARWYVVHTHSGHEAKVAATLKQRIESQKLSDKVIDILVPTQEKIEIKDGKKSTVKEKIFPGYLLIRMVLDDNTWLAVRTTPGITSFVGVSNRPTPLPDQEVATIQRYMTMEAPKFKATFSAGEAVKIVDGPFSEFLGSISEIDDEKGKLKVLVSIFGRETPVELDFLQVAKL